MKHKQLARISQSYKFTALIAQFMIWRARKMISSCVLECIYDFRMQRGYGGGSFEKCDWRFVLMESWNGITLMLKLLMVLGVAGCRGTFEMDQKTKIIFCTISDTSMPQLDDPIKLHYCLIKALHGISFYDSPKTACNAPVNPAFTCLLLIRSAVWRTRLNWASFSSKIYDAF